MILVIGYGKAFRISISAYKESFTPMNGDTLNAGRVSVRRCAFLRSAKNFWRELMKKLGILLLAAAFAVCGLMTFAACNEETLGPDEPDDPIVTPEPDEPGKPDDPTPPDEPTPPEEPEATEGLVFELLTTENSDGFEEILGADFEDCYVCTGLTTAEENVVIPSTYNGLPVRVVRAYGEESDAFNGITSLYIPDSVQLIQWNENDTFESLTDIRLPRNPNAMISGGNYFSGCAFYNDPNNWEDGALYMDGWLLATNGDLPEEYTVKQGTYGIAAVAFVDPGVSYGSLKKVIIPDGVQSLVGSFAGCLFLKEVVLPDSLSSIGYSAFLLCNSLTSITIPNSVTSIGDYAFVYCDSLTRVTIGDGVTSIGDGAFWDCDSLETVYYRGSEEEWNEIEIGLYNGNLLNAEIVFNYKGE